MKRVLVLTVCWLVFGTLAHAQNWVRDYDNYKMRAKQSPEDAIGIYQAFLSVPPENDNACDYIWDLNMALTFDLQELADKVGLSFDVNRLYFSANSIAASDFLEAWQDDWDRHANETRDIPAIGGPDWSNRSVSFCVGKGTWVVHPISTMLGPQGLYLWHDTPKITPQQMCGASTCNVGSQIFSDGDLVGWYPKGNCSSATHWFDIAEVGGEYTSLNRLEMDDVCICR
jgi:hypothetical protein